MQSEGPSLLQCAGTFATVAAVPQARNAAVHHPPNNVAATRGIACLMLRFKLRKAMRTKRIDGKIVLMRAGAYMRSALTWQKPLVPCVVVLLWHTMLVIK